MTVGRIYWRLVSGLLRRLMRSDDPWVRYPTLLPRHTFGDNHQSPVFLLDSETSVTCGSLDDVCEWLAECEKVKAQGDPAAEAAVDPVVFEQSRRGNCRAHAQWAFVKLAQLGYDPALIHGRWTPSPSESGNHMWIVFTKDGEEWLLESTESNAASMIQPLSAVREAYVPVLGATASGRQFVFPGYTTGMDEAWRLP